MQHFPSKALLRIGAKQPYSRPGAASRHFPRLRLSVERAGRSHRASIASPTRGETRDQRPRSGEEPRWDSGRLRGGLSRRWENQLQRFSPLSPLFQLHPGASFNL